ncbi:MAG: hypothetical protein JJE03_04680 [Peptostreptococcaceae bacterium]|nr:hypothetical protein [Peptostreptococcaceae bacterium]
MFTFNTSFIVAIGGLLLVFIGLFLFNEAVRRNDKAGFFAFVVLPIVLTILWLTTLRDTTYTDWFHLFKVYSSDAGCIGFWLIGHWEKKDKKTGEITWRFANNKIALCFPPLILAINIAEAVIRDFQVGAMHLNLEENGGQILLSGNWNYLNAIAGIFLILTITGWFGIKVKKPSPKDGSKDMLWPDMLWFWIVAYDIWNFAYTYNCLPGHAWYCGIALLLAPTLCAFTLGKGAWLQHRAYTLAIWCMFAQTFPLFQDNSIFSVTSTYNPAIYMFFGIAALVSNVAVFVYMIYKVTKTKRNPYAAELYTDLKDYKEIDEMAS